MGKSVKLNDGSYIDAEGVWDNALGMTLEEANNGGEQHTISATIVFSGTTYGSLIWRRIGKLVFAHLRNVQFPRTTARTTFTTTCSAVGMPKPAILAQSCLIGNDSKYGGFLGIEPPDTINLVVMADMTYIGGCLWYIAAD